MIKYFLNAIMSICVFILLFLLLKKEDAMTTYLKAAGKNAAELQKVIDHYKLTKEKEKLDCVYFLIQNMAGKGSIEYSFLDSTGHIMLLDTCSALKRPQLIHSILSKGEFTNRTVKSDLEYITADFLIENIDIAFEVRSKYPWCKQLTKKDFLSTILPYRIKNEPLSNWRYFYYNKHKAIADSLAERNAKMEDVVFYFNKFYGKKYIQSANCLLGEQSHHMIENIGGGTCDHLALNAAQMFRSIGIALNLDILPYHGKANGGHVYNSFINEKEDFIYFSPYEREPERKQWIAPLVYRIHFTEPTKENVTQNYYKTTQIHLTEQDICLATFNRGQFKKIIDSESTDNLSRFANVSCGLLYFPMKEKGESLAPTNINPFIIDEEGNPSFIKSHPKEFISLPCIHLYDVKRILPLKQEPYILLGWDKGWKEISRKLPDDLNTLLFDSIPNYGLFLIYGSSGIEKMQRPFLLNDKTVQWY